MGERVGKMLVDRRSGYKRLTYALVIGVMIIIFMFSSQPGTNSNALSNQFIHVYELAVEHLLFLSDTNKTLLLAKPSHYVRKLAHLTIFAILGSVTFLALWQKRKSFLSCMVLAVLICMLYASLDEWHQYYVAGREAQLSDVLLDTLGASIGILSMGIIQILMQYFEKNIKSILLMILMENR